MSPNNNPFRKAVITGMPCKPEWSELRYKIRVLKYAELTCPTTQKRDFVVYAYAEPGMRKKGRTKLFAVNEIVKVSEFEDCDSYCLLKAKGLLKTLGEPLCKDVVGGKKKKRKVCDKWQLLEVENHLLEQRSQWLKDENQQLRQQLRESEKRKAAEICADAHEADETDEVGQDEAADPI